MLKNMEILAGEQGGAWTAVKRCAVIAAWTASLHGAGTVPVS
jgi:hypothetical protein